MPLINSPWLGICRTAIAAGCRASEGGSEVIADGTDWATPAVDRNTARPRRTKRIENLLRKILTRKACIVYYQQSRQTLFSDFSAWGRTASEPDELDDERPMGTCFAPPIGCGISSGTPSRGVPSGVLGLAANGLCAPISSENSSEMFALEASGELSLSARHLTAPPSGTTVGTDCHGSGRFPVNSSWLVDDRC